MEEWIVASKEAKERIEKGIEQNRKGSFRIFAPEGATVRVKLKRHRFRFGCNLFMLDEFPDDPSKNAVYRKQFAELFNMATLPFYWDATEPREGALRYAIGSKPCYRRPPIDLCMQYCEENGIEPREHALCYEKFFPAWLKDRSVPEIKQHLERRMQEISERYANRIPTIEVTNEMFWDEGTTPFYGSPDYAEFCFRLAEQYFPHNRLCINEWTRATWGSSGLPWCQYRLLIDDLLLRGARIDAIGMQYHMFFRREEAFEKTRRPYDLDHDLRVMDSYAAFGMPLQITEVTIPAYTEQAEDEELQADILER
ncbi:MAG TPA: hypothetical protein DDW30_05585, partial [Clostridiales bacterium]|nr:hypothetical protein [Clostridiales bacterium]